MYGATKFLNFDPFTYEGYQVIIQVPFFSRRPTFIEMWKRKPKDKFRKIIIKNEVFDKCPFIIYDKYLHLTAEQYRKLKHESN